MLVVLNFSGGPLQVDGAKWGMELGEGAGQGGGGGSEGAGRPVLQGTYRDIFTGAAVVLPGAAIELKAWGYTVLEKMRVAQ